MDGAIIMAKRIHPPGITKPPARTRRSPFNLYASDSPVHNIKLRFANNLKKAIAAKGWNESEVARRMEAIRPPHPGRRNVGRDMVNHWTHAIHFPSAEFIGLLAKVLEKRIGELVPQGLMLGDDDPIPFAIVTLPGGRAELTINMYLAPKVAMEVSQFLAGDPSKKRPHVPATVIPGKTKSIVQVKSIVPAGIAYIVQRIIFEEPDAP